MWHRHASKTSKHRWPLNNLFEMRAKKTHECVRAYAALHAHMQRAFLVSQPQIQNILVSDTVG